MIAPIEDSASIAVMNRSQLILVLLLRAIAVAASQAIVSVFVIPRCGGPARNDSMTRVQIEQRKEPEVAAQEYSADDRDFFPRTVRPCRGRLPRRPVLRARQRPARHRFRDR